MSGRVYDRNQPVRELSPAVIADQRAEQLTDATEDDRAHFMLWFQRARIAVARDDQRLYGWYRTALDGDDSVAVAGIVEGIASTRKEGLVI